MSLVITLRVSSIGGLSLQRAGLLRSTGRDADATAAGRRIAKAKLLGVLLGESGEPGAARTRDLLINIPLRLSSPRLRVRGLDFPFTVTLAGFRWAPSSLYTFPLRGLARDRRRRDADGFPEFDAIPSAVSHPTAPYEVNRSTN